MPQTAPPIPGPAKELLRVNGLEVDFDGFKAIQDLNISLREGELRFLIGPNGAGKTTLLDSLCGKVKPSKGTIRFREHDVSRYQEHRLAELGIGRKFQAPSIFANLSVGENLEIALKQPRGIWASLKARLTSEQKDRIAHYLGMIGLLEKAGLTAGALSHGEKQWLEIGMLLAQEPELLLLDEPAAGMTDAETHKTGELLHAIASRQSVIVVEHDMEFVRQFAFTVTVMHEGRILREGTMEDIQNDARVAEVYLGRRVEHDA